MGQSLSLALEQEMSFSSREFEDSKPRNQLVVLTK